MISQMVADSLQVTFRGCPAKELLAPYSEAFRLMNRRASYLREDPMGYHEKAFDLFLPYSLEEAAIEITRDRYLPFWLDAAEHPEHYEGKFLQFSDPLELRKDAENGSFRAGRVVMTCCMSDLQFMSFALEGSPSVPDSGGWFTFEACGFIGTNEHRQRILKLKGENYKAAQPPKDLILKP